MAAAKPKKRKAKAVVQEEPQLDEARFRTIHHIWPDFRIQSCITHSIVTVKADAAQRSFTALGEGIVWAVMDSGIDADHPHFKAHGNIDRTSSYHADFTDAPTGAAPLKDEYGHGTAIAGIVAGQGDNGRGISGVMWRASLMSLRVLDNTGSGDVGSAVEAIDYALAHGAQVINLSWGTTANPAVLKERQ